MANARQRKFVKEYASGKSGTQAAKDAGYKEKAAGQQACALLKNPHVQSALQKALEKAGITDEKIAGKLNEQMEADRPYGGKADVVAPDNQARHAAVETAIKIKGGFAPTKTEVKGDVTLRPSFDDVLGGGKK